MERRAVRSLAVLLATTAGALWGGVAYATLWGYTSIVITPRFFDSPAGVLALLPVRIVLDAIHVVEAHVVGHPFAFARNHGWIGFLAAAVGAILVGLPTIGIVRLSRARSARR